MAGISYRRHRFPPDIIQHAVWLYLRFTLSYRDVEDLLAERGLDISYETVRSWVLKFGPVIARRLRRRRPRPSDRWHLDEMVVRIAGERMYLWRAVDHEGEVLDSGRRGNGCGVPFCDAPPACRQWRRRNMKGRRRVGYELRRRGVAGSGLGESPATRWRVLVRFSWPGPSLA